jgi:hypothetical protein
MKDIFKKKIRNYFSLILLMFFGITAQAQWNEGVLQAVVIINNNNSNNNSNSYNNSALLAMLAANIWTTGSPYGPSSPSSPGTASSSASSSTDSSTDSPYIYFKNRTPFTQAELDKNIDFWTRHGWELETKENQPFSISGGKTQIGTLFKFNNGSFDFYYFTPNASDSQLKAGLYYAVIIGPNGGSGSQVPDNGNPNNPANPPPTTPFIYGYGADGFPTGQGTIYNATGTLTGITFGTNTSPPTLVAGCNPCEDFTPDPNGGNAGGVTNQDAKLLHNDILNVLNKSTKFDKFKALLKRGPKNNKQFFSKIPPDKLVEALKDLDTEDQRVFATIVANTLNSDKLMYIKYFKEDEVLVAPDTPERNYSLIPSEIVPKVDKAYFEYYLKFGETGEDGKGFTLNELIGDKGAGGTAKGTNVVISLIRTYWSSYNEVIPLHEFFGHGRPLSIETPTSLHNQDDALLFENLVWRLLGMPENQRDGHDHANEQLLKDKSALPSFR